MTELSFIADPASPENPWLTNHYKVHDSKSAKAVFDGLGRHVIRDIPCSCVSMVPAFRIPATGEVVEVDGVYRDYSFQGTYFHAHIGGKAVGLSVYPVFGEAIQKDKRTYEMEVSYICIIVMSAEEMIYTAKDVEVNLGKPEDTKASIRSIADCVVHLSVSKLLQENSTFS